MGLEEMLRGGQFCSCTETGGLKKNTLGDGDVGQGGSGHDFKLGS